MIGYEAFFEKPGEIQERRCRVCGTVCEAKRDQVGPTGWAEAVGNHSHLHDYFQCPYTGEAWHRQALELVQAIEKTPSERVAALMQQDLVELLEAHGIEMLGMS